MDNFLGVFIKQVCQEKQENMLGFQGALASFHFSFNVNVWLWAHPWKKNLFEDVYPFVDLTNQYKSDQKDNFWTQKGFCKLPLIN